MRFVGIDVGITTTGICILQEDGTYEPIEVSVPNSVMALNDFSRFDWLLNSICAAIGYKKEPSMYMFEDYAMWGKGQITRIAEFTGQLKRAIYLAQIQRISGPNYGIFVASPNTLKKFATGAGKGKKSLIIKAVYKKWDFDTDSDDVADAFVLAKMCHLLFSYMGSLTGKADLKYEHECMVAILKQNKIDRKQLLS